jgi:hypothetical protein
MIHTFFTPEEAQDIKRQYYIKAQQLQLEKERHRAQCAGMYVDREYMAAINSQLERALCIVRKVSSGILEITAEPQTPQQNDNH